jgi:hypothetical protein
MDKNVEDLARTLATNAINDASNYTQNDVNSERFIFILNEIIRRVKLAIEDSE